MRMTILTLAGAVVALAACSGGKDSKTRTFAAACIAGGESESFCACQGDALRAELDDETFTALADFAEAMADTSEEGQGVIAMGALSNTKLVAAFDKAEAAAKTCKRQSVRRSAPGSPDQRR